MEIKIIKEKISQAELKSLAESSFGEVVKVVVDIERNILAIGGELHADEESVLLDDGSKQENLWGINYYPWKDANRRIEYIALINIRPALGNKSMRIENNIIRDRVKRVVENLLLSSDEKMA
jgi:hypothetical protein